MRVCIILSLILAGGIILGYLTFASYRQKCQKEFILGFLADSNLVAASEHSINEKKEIIKKAFEIVSALPDSPCPSLKDEEKDLIYNSLLLLSSNRNRIRDILPFDLSQEEETVNGLRLFYRLSLIANETAYEKYQRTSESRVLLLQGKVLYSIGMVFSEHPHLLISTVGYGCKYKAAEILKEYAQVSGDPLFARIVKKIEKDVQHDKQYLDKRKKNFLYITHEYFLTHKNAI